jgi:hypothetical protein
MLGTLTVVVPDSEATGRALMFLPALMPAGIEPADPMIQFRNKARRDPAGQGRQACPWNIGSSGGSAMFSM